MELNKIYKASKEDLQKLDEKRKELLFFAGEISDCYSIIEKLDIQNRDKIIDILRDKRKEIIDEAQAIFDYIIYQNKRRS